MEALLKFVESHPWWTLVYLCVIFNSLAAFGAILAHKGDTK